MSMMQLLTAALQGSVAPPTFPAFDTSYTTTVTYSESDHKAVVSGVNHVAGLAQSFSTGKKYIEFKFVSETAIYSVVGIGSSTVRDWYSDANSWAMTNTPTGSGNTYYNTTITGTAYVPRFTAGDIISIAADGSKLWFAVNGTWIGDTSGNVGNPSAGTYPRYNNLTGTLVPYVAQSIGSGSATWIVNSGGNGDFSGTETAQGNTDTNGYGDFYYPVPTGFSGIYIAA